MQQHKNNLTYRHVEYDNNVNDRYRRILLVGIDFGVTIDNTKKHLTLVLLLASTQRRESPTYILHPP